MSHSEVLTSPAVVRSSRFPVVMASMPAGACHTQAKRRGTIEEIRVPPRSGLEKNALRGNDTLHPIARVFKGSRVIMRPIPEECRISDHQCRLHGALLRRDGDR